MSLTYVQYVADGTTAEFDVPFPFASRTHVKVTINGAPPIHPLRWVGESRIALADNIAAGSLVEVRRETPLSERLVDFQNGSVLTEEELDLAINQIFYIQQELKDRYDRGLGSALHRVAVNGGLTSVDPANVIEELANLVISEELVSDLRQAIADIGLNAEEITKQALDTSALTEVVAQADVALATLRVDSEAAVADLRADHDQLVDIVDALAGGDPGTGLATLIQDETNARIAGDTALVNTIALIGAKSWDNLAFILDTSKVRVSPTESLATRLSALSATDATNAAAVISEQNARISADNSLSSSITGLTARMGTAEANIISANTARADGDSALATQLNTLTTRVGSAEASITAANTARSEGDSALTSSLSALTSRVGTAEANIVSANTARVDGDNALANTLALLGAKNGANTAFVLDTSKVQLGGGETLATRLSALAATDSSNLALIQSEQTARISADNVLTSSVNSLGSRMGNAESAIVAEQNARAAGDTAEANARTALAARVTTAEGNISANSAAITNEASVRANADSAFAQQLSLLGAQNGGGTAWILDLNKVRVDGTTSLGTRLSGIDTQIANNAATIVAEQTARVNADSALSQQITTLTTTVNGNTASVNTLQSSVNGLQARYGVSLNVNGYVTGFIQNNDGASGTFTIVADRFAIVAPNGGSPVVPFTVTASGVQINGNLIVNGSIVGNQFDLTTMVKRGTLSWSGTNTPSVNNKTVVAYTDLGPVGKDGSYRFDYDVRFDAQLGVEYSTYNGLPMSTTYAADGYVGLEIIGDGGAILASILFSGSEFQGFGNATYQLTKQGQYVADRVGAAQSNIRLQLVAYRTNADTGIINDGDNYRRTVSGVYTAKFTNSSAKWTIL